MLFFDGFIIEVADLTTDTARRADIRQQFNPLDPSPAIRNARPERIASNSQRGNNADASNDDVTRRSLRHECTQ